MCDPANKILANSKMYSELSSVGRVRRSLKLVEMNTDPITAILIDTQCVVESYSHSTNTAMGATKIGNDCAMGIVRETSFLDKTLITNTVLNAQRIPDTMLH